MKRLGVIISVILVCAVAAAGFAFFANGAEGPAGDVNLDGTVNAADTMLVLNCSSGLSELNGEQFIRADVTYDGIVNSTDALRILMYIAGNVSDLGDVGAEEGDDLIM